MKKILCFIAVALMGVVAFAQTVTLTFTGRDAADHYVQLNRVTITNLTKGWSETIYWPDTTLIMQNGSGIDESVANGGFALSQNNPNPFSGTTDVNLTVVDAGAVTLEIVDGNGKIVGTHRMYPEIGTHQFRVSLSAAGTYVMTARQNGKTSSIKMVCNGGGSTNAIEYLGMVQTITYVLKSTTTNPFNFGDQMEYVGYATINGTEVESQRITQAQGTSQTFVLQFPVVQHQTPTVTTTVVSNVTETSATCGGIVTADGGTNVIVRGVCYSTSPAPTTADNHTTDGSGTGSFTGSLTGLTAGTTYYVRAYATNSVGTAYGNEVSFTTTIAAQLPTVTTTAASNVAETSATCGGIVTTDGGDNVIVRGVCYSTSPAPTAADNHTTDGSGTGSFTSSLTGLTAGTTYYVRAYATNSVGTAYGNEVSFTTTVAAQLPTVTTTTASNVAEATATCGGTVTTDGGANVIVRGVCYSTSPAPTTADNHTTDGSGTGSFTSSLTGLTAGTTYYVRAYATNSVGTAYGNEVSFTTTAIPTTQDGQPCPNTPTLTDIDGNTYNTVQIGQQCWMKENLRTTHYANSSAIEQGSSTSTTTPYWYYPNNDANNMSTYGLLYNWVAVMNGASSSNNNPSGVQGLCPSGWHLPSEVEWTQLTDYVSSQNLYMCNSDIDYIAKAMASTIGWNSNSNTCAVGNTPDENNATGFSAMPAGGYFVNGINNSFGAYAYFWSTTEHNDTRAYRLRLTSAHAYVSHSDNEKVGGFSIRCLKDNGSSTTYNLPTVTTNAVSNVAETSATCGGNVSSDGGATVTARGVCWSTSQNPTTSSSHTTDGSGMGSFTSSLTGLTASTTYYVRAYATNSIGTTYGNEVSFTTTTGSSAQDGQPCPGTPTLTDVDGNTYNTVWIGQQCWMKENLRTTKYADGTSILVGPSCTQTSTKGYWYYPNKDSSNNSTYGLLYNWKAVIRNTSATPSTNPNRLQGICPTGWHVPSNAEWTQLTDYVSSQSQYICGSSNTHIAKSLATQTGWVNSSEDCAIGNTPNANNATGFSALPAGYCQDAFGYGAFFWLWNSYEYHIGGTVATLWHSTESPSDLSPSDLCNKPCASVRCIKGDGNTVQTLPAVQTLGTSYLATIAICGGNVTDDGGATVTARGVCWSINHNPTIGNSHTTDGSGTDRFTSTLTGLAGNTTYYVRAYATNSIGTAYGEERSFTTFSTQGATIILEAHDVWQDGSGYQLLLDANATAYGSIIPESGPLTSSGDADAATYAAFEYKIPQNADGATTTSNIVLNGSATITIPAGYYDFCITNPTPGDRIWIAGGDDGRKDNFYFDDGKIYHFYISMNEGYDNVTLNTFNSNLTYGQPCQDTPTLTDIDGNTYNTVQIGNQCWMRGNLRTTHYADNTPIAQGNDISDNIPYWYYPDNNPSNRGTYGLLYNWPAVMHSAPSSNTNPSGVQGICPTGWHVPSNAEWTQLTDYVSSQSQYCYDGNSLQIAKALSSNTEWIIEDEYIYEGAVCIDQLRNNATGFSALPAGGAALYYYDCTYNFGISASFWSATEKESAYAYIRFLVANSSEVGGEDYDYNKYVALSVRCVKN